MTAASRRREAERRQKAAELRKAEAARQRKRRQLIVVSSAVAVLVLAGVIGFVVSSSGGSKAPTTPPAATVVSQKTSGFTVGKASAPVTMDEFEDFQCPVCGDLEKQTGATIRQLTDAGKIKVVYHMLSFIDDNSGGKTTYSKRSANAAACVQQYAPAKWRDFHDLLYAHQPAEGSAGLTNAQLIAYGKQVGATAPAFTSCVNDRTYRGYVAKVQDDASKAGFNGTPALTLNGGKTLENASGGPLLSPAELTKAVTAAAAAAAK